MDTYLFDDILSEFMSKMPEYKNRQCLDVFNIINNINNIPGNNLDFSLENLETNLIELVTSNESETDNLIDKYIITINMSVNAYISYYGIYLDTKSTDTLLSALNALYTYLTLDIDLLDRLEDILNNENTEDNEIVAAMLAEYSDVSQFEWLEVISSVSPDFTDNMMNYIRYRRTIATNEINIDLLNKVNKLIQIDNQFKNTLIAKLINSNELNKTFTHETYLSSVYAVLDNYTDPSIMPYEIVMLYSLSDDTKNTISESIREDFNFSYIDAIEHDQGLISAVTDTTLDLAKKVMAEIGND